MSVDLWALGLADLPQDVVEMLLTSAERDAVHAFHRLEDRARASVGRAGLRLILGRRLGRDPAKLCFEQPAGHRPVLKGEPHAPSFSVTHSGELVLIAVADVPVGVDAECWRKSDWSDLAERFFHESETRWINGCPPESQDERFFRLWTMKEAYLKGLGVGLGRALDSFSVPCLGGIVDDPDVTERWHVAPLDIWPGYSAALAVRGNGGARVWHDCKELVSGTNVAAEF